MKTKNFFMICVCIICSFSIITCASTGDVKDEEINVVNKIVTITSLEGIKPSTVTSSPGTTVVWVNHDQLPIEILFLDKKVVLSCGSPVNFFVGKNGAYESAKIPFGGTASLCFLEKGKYEYLFKASSTFYPSNTKEHQGIIWIK